MYKAKSNQTERALRHKEQTMDIHHAMFVRNRLDRLYEALTQPRDLAVWMGAPTLPSGKSGR
jgi:uncharacterized protein YndB with AHSA1/START domain